MPEPELSLLFIRPLNHLAVRYLVIGWWLPFFTANCHERHHLPYRQ